MDLVNVLYILMYRSTCLRCLEYLSDIEVFQFSEYFVFPNPGEQTFTFQILHCLMVNVPNTFVTLYIAVVHHEAVIVKVCLYLRFSLVKPTFYEYRITAIILLLNFWKSIFINFHFKINTLHNVNIATSFIVWLSPPISVSKMFWTIDLELEFWASYKFFHENLVYNGAFQVIHLLQMFQIIPEYCVKKWYCI